MPLSIQKGRPSAGTRRMISPAFSKRQRRNESLKPRSKDRRTRPVFSVRRFGRSAVPLPPSSSFDYDPKLALAGSKKAEKGDDDDRYPRLGRLTYLRPAGRIRSNHPVTNHWRTRGRATASTEVR
jgi:hypothetical protein